MIWKDSFTPMLGSSNVVSLSARLEAGASRREAAERFEISASSAVKWLQRWRDHGMCAPKPCGGSRSVLEDYGERILALVAEQPDRTLDEIVAAMRK
jgi:transposase